MRLRGFGRAAATLAVGAMALLPVAAAAQDVGPALNPSLMVGWTGGNAARQANKRRAAAAVAPLNLRSVGNGLTAAPARAVPVGALAYRPDMELRRRHYAQFVSRAREVDPIGADRLQQVLASGDVMNKMQAWMSRYGLSTRNVADSVAVYLTAAWFATRGNEGDPSRAQIVGVRNQLAQAMLANPQFARAPDAVKQEVAEANLIQAVVAQQYADAAKRDPAMQAKVRQAVASGARASYGLDLLSLDLTSQGLR